MELPTVTWCWGTLAGPCLIRCSIRQNGIGLVLLSRTLSHYVQPMRSNDVLIITHRYLFVLYSTCPLFVSTSLWGNGRCLSTINNRFYIVSIGFFNVLRYKIKSVVQNTLVFTSVMTATLYSSSLKDFHPNTLQFNHHNNDE